MAIPTWVKSCTGVTDAGGTFAFAGAGSWASNITAGNLIVFQVLQDGTGSGEVSFASVSAAIDNLAGSNGVTSIGTFDVGSAVAARQHLWIGRVATTGNSANFNGSNSGTDDVYCIAHEFTDCSTGTTLATVIENGTAGSTANGAGTSTTVADTGVTTLGVDRLALNLIGINDDATGLASFAGETGGDWVQRAIFETATGTDGTVAVQDAAMAAAGTINGGTATITLDAWGVVGFAIIGTTVAAAAVPTRNPWPALQAVNRAGTY